MSINETVSIAIIVDNKEEEKKNNSNGEKTKAFVRIYSGGIFIKYNFDETTLTRLSENVLESSTFCFTPYIFVD